MVFDTLVFEACRVVQFQEHHLTERYVSWLNDPEVVRFSEQRHRRHTLVSCRGYFESFRNSPDLFLAIEAADDLGHIGNMSASIDTANCVADLSIMVGEKRAWGKGHATRAWRGVMEHLLSNGNIRKATAGTMAVNRSMLGLMQRTGMNIEGRRERQFIFEGQEVDLVMAARFR